MQENWVIQKMKNKLNSRMDARRFSSNERRVAEKIFEKISESVEFDRIEIGIKESNQFSPKRNRRPTYRTHLVKKAADDVVVRLVKAVENNDTSVTLINAGVWRRIDEWCKKHINPLKG